MGLVGYRDVELVGEGGLGRVYRAVRESTGGVVAIKELRDVPSASPAWHRARRELDAMLRLKGHPYVVSVEEIFDGPSGPCIVMEYLDGGSLMDRLGHGRLAVPELLLVGEQVTQALGAAHEAGIVHRDVKPHNLLIGSFGQIKVADFGIAALTRGAGLQTQTQAFTLAYASPEELDGEVVVGPAADVYSFAATFLHLATGRKPSFRERGDLGELDEVARRHPVMMPVAQALRSSLEVAPERRPSMASLHRVFTTAASQLAEWRIIRLHAPGSVGDPPLSAPMVAEDTSMHATVVRQVPPAPSGPQTVPPPPVQPIHPAQPVPPSYAAAPPVYVTAPPASGDGRRWFAVGASIALLCLAAVVATVIATRGGDDGVAGAEPAPASTVLATAPVTTAVPATTTAPATTLAPTTTAAPTTVAATVVVTVPPTTVVPITVAPPITASPLPSQPAVDFFANYLATADAGDPAVAWAMLTPRYQAKYKTYEANFVPFWDTVNGTSVRQCTSISEAPDARGFECEVWYTRAKDGTISKEIVQVDVILDPNTGLMMIDDYRYQHDV